MPVPTCPVKLIRQKSKPFRGLVYASGAKMKREVCFCHDPNNISQAAIFQASSRNGHQILEPQLQEYFSVLTALNTRTPQTLDFLGHLQDRTSRRRRLPTERLPFLAGTQLKGRETCTYMLSPVASQSPYLVNTTKAPLALLVLQSCQDSDYHSSYLAAIHTPARFDSS